MVVIPGHMMTVHSAFALVIYFSLGGFQVEV